MATFTRDESRKIFAYFLNAKEIKQYFKGEGYGYRTYNNQWKIFHERNIIVKHNYVQIFVNGEYESRLQEIIYTITRNPNSIDIRFYCERLIG